MSQASHSEDRPTEGDSEGVSEKKRAANRANAKKSTGPRTPAGKARVSLNALTHGLTSAAAVLPYENQDHFDKMAAVMRAQLKPRGFVQQLMVERLIEVAWKQRRATKAVSQHAGRRLDKHLSEFATAREEGAWIGPDLPLTGTEMLVDSAEGDAEAAAFLRLELYADRLQRAYQTGLNHLRREQKRQADLGDEVPGAEEAGNVEVALEDDPLENAHFENKPTGRRRRRAEVENVMRYWVEPDKRVPLKKIREQLMADSQNKATEETEEETKTDGAKPETSPVATVVEAPAEALEDLPPSPGTPGEGRGEGLIERERRERTVLSEEEPSPQPSPGVPGEGEAQPVDVRRDPDPRHQLPPWHPLFDVMRRAGG